MTEPGVQFLRSRVSVSLLCPSPEAGEKEQLGFCGEPDCEVQEVEGDKGEGCCLQR